MSQYTLSLDYKLAPGWLQSYTDGLAEGQAISWRCTDCERISFPPVRTCTCGQTAGAWVALTGHARVQHYTFGHDGTFALVRFDGADTSAVVKLLSLEKVLALSTSVVRPDELTGRLQRTASSFAGLVLKVNRLGKTA